MTSYFDKLNLTVQERRLVVFVGLFLFVVLNLWLVWPHFGDLGIWQQRKKEITSKLHQYQVEIKKEPTYRQEREKLKQAGGNVSDEARARELLRTVQRQAVASNVRLPSVTPGKGGSSATNAFFDEEAVLISFESGQKELIDFLYNLGAHGSLIRVRNMTVGPELPNRYKLTGNMTLVESFARRTPGAPAPTATTTRPTPPVPTAASTPSASTSGAASPAATPPANPDAAGGGATPIPTPPAPGSAPVNPTVRPKTKTSQPEVRPVPIHPTNSVVIPKRRVLTPPPSGKTTP